MNPLDIHLKFPNESTATRLLLQAGIWVELNNTNVDAHNYLTDVIGIIYKPTGKLLTDEDGNKYQETTDVGGWHVNMRGDLPEIIKPYKITVTGTPHRIWD
jgi:hypothetical protein